MRRAIVDAGPLIALFDRSDSYHERVVDFLRLYDGKLYSTWPVLTEVSHMLDFHLGVQIDFLKWVSLGGIEVVELESADLVAIMEYMQKYLDVPMDLADASLIRISDKLQIDKIVTIDRDFYIFKNKKQKHLKNLLNEGV